MIAGVVGRELDHFQSVIDLDRIANKALQACDRISEWIADFQFFGDDGEFCRRDPEVETPGEIAERIIADSNLDVQSSSGVHAATYGDLLSPGTVGGFYPGLAPVVDKNFDFFPVVVIVIDGEVLAGDGDLAATGDTALGGIDGDCGYGDVHFGAGDHAGAVLDFQLLGAVGVQSHADELIGKASVAVDGNHAAGETPVAGHLWVLSGAVNIAAL